MHLILKGQENQGLCGVVSGSDLYPALQQLLKDKLWHTSAPPKSLSQMGVPNKGPWSEPPRVRYYIWGYSGYQ